MKRKIKEQKEEIRKLKKEQEWQVKFNFLRGCMTI